jgi:hypothetical protein
MYRCSGVHPAATRRIVNSAHVGGARVARGPSLVATFGDHLAEVLQAREAATGQLTPARPSPGVVDVLILAGSNDGLAEIREASAVAEQLRRHLHQRSPSGVRRVAVTRHTFHTRPARAAAWPTSA